MHEGTTAAIQVLVAHGLPLVRAGLLATLGRQPDMQVQIGSADGRVQAASGLDIVVLDCAAGLALAAALRQQPLRGARGCQVMIVTALAGEWEIRQAVSLGVLGFHRIDAPLERLVAAVRTVAAGGRSFDAGVVARIADSLVLPELTQREREVLLLLAQGACNKEIANRLHIALGTVKAHVRTLLDKLQVESRVQAIVVAKQRGMVAMHEAAEPRGGG